MSKIIEESRFICGPCGEWYLLESDAVDCCPTEANKFTVYICTGCNNTYLFEYEAKECYAEDEEVSE